MSWLIDNTEAQDVLNDWAVDRTRPQKPEKTGLLKASGLGVMRGGVNLARGTALAASTLFPHEDAPDDGSRVIPRKEDFFRFIETKLDQAEKYWTPDPESVGMAGQIVGALSELPLQLAGGPGLMAVSSGLNSGAKLVEQGVDGNTAAVAAFGAGTANALMMKLPQAGKGVLQTTGLVAVNPLIGAGQDLALKKGLEAQGYTEQAAAIDPLNPVSRLVDLTMGGVFGALGYHANRVTERANATAFENVATRAEDYHNLIQQAGGEKAIREQLPVEAVDSLDTVRSHLKTLETNPFSKEAIDGVDRHLDSLKSAIGNVTEGKPVDVSAQVAEVIKPAPRPLELQTLMDKWSARYGLTPDEEAGVSSLIQARAKVLGMASDEFVSKHFADVTNEAPGAGALMQARPMAQPFYSKLLKEVDALPQEKWNPSDLLNKIRKTEGVKAEEIAWTGLEEFLQGKKSVTRAEVKEYLDKNQVQIDEVKKGFTEKDAADKALTDFREQGRLVGFPAGEINDLEIQLWKGELKPEDAPEGLKDTAEKLVHALQARDATEAKNQNIGRSKFDTYVTPGGENYRELLLTLPDKHSDYVKKLQTKYGDSWVKDSTPEETAHREKLFMLTGRDYRSSHFDEPNILAHVRFNERTAPDGERLLHLEEVQSDWHQARRDGKDVPDAPFAKSWHELAARRMLRYAAEEGFDRLTWTTGEQQAERYDISKKMDSVSYRPEGDQYHLSGVDVHGNEHALGTFSKGQLPDAVGKELSQKITGGEGKPDGQWMKLTGPDLKVGGSGMKGFYDKMLPQYLEKLGKKFGAKVENINLEPGTTNLEPVSVHSIPITDAMRDSLLYEGQPLFQGQKGAVSFLADGRAVIHALQQPDFSTAVHELAHVFAKTLDTGEKMQFDKWLLNFSRGKGEWNTADHEAFARGFETYLAEGKAPTPELQSVFDKFKNWLVEIYRNIMGSPLETRLHPEAQKAFDRLLFNEVLKKEAPPEVVKIQTEAAAIVPDRETDLHDLAGMDLPEPETTIPKPQTTNLEPRTPNRILRDFALQTYEDPEMIKRFVAEPTNVAGALAHALEIEAKRLDSAKGAKQGPSLVEYLRQVGVSDDRGDLAAMDIDKSRKAFAKNVLRPDGMALDKVREAAVEKGYLPEDATTADLLDSIGQELRGQPVYPPGDTVSIPEWFQSIVTMNRRTGKFGDAVNQAAAALRKTAEGKFDKLTPKQQDIVLAALDHINYTAQSTAREIDAFELKVGDRYMATDMAYHTVVAERDGSLVLDNGQTIQSDSLLKILGEVDQSGRPPEKGYDALDYQVESLLQERGDFEVFTGTDAAGNSVMKSAREFVDEAKNNLAATENRKHLYDRAAACMGLEF